MLSPRTVAVAALLGVAGLAAVPSARTLASDIGPVCTFERGVTACQSTVNYTETGQHIEVSGSCYIAVRGPIGVRERTFTDTYQVTAVVTTLRHGRNGVTFSTDTVVTSRSLIGSQLVSDVCRPL